jgi:polyisoprenoid-binding protein YceI
MNKGCAGIALFILMSLICGMTHLAVAAETYLVDKTHTLVGFTVRHLVINKVRGKFNDFTGTIIYDEQDITKSALEGTIQVASIDTDNEKRDTHLRSADFFDAANHPQITFVSQRVEQASTTHRLVGDVTIRGITKEIEIPFTITGKIKDLQGKRRIGFEAILRINRQDFGVAYSKVMDNGGLVVGNTVNIELIGEAVKQDK